MSEVALSVMIYQHDNMSVTFWYCKGWRPLWPQDVQTDAPITVDVRVIYFCCEGYLWRRHKSQRMTFRAWRDLWPFRQDSCLNSSSSAHSFTNIHSRWNFVGIRLLWFEWSEQVVRNKQQRHVWETNAAICHNSPSDVSHLWWFEGIVCREVNGEEEHSTLKWAVSLMERAQAKLYSVWRTHLFSMIATHSVSNQSCHPCFTSNLIKHSQIFFSLYIVTEVIMAYNTMFHRQIP